MNGASVPELLGWGLTAAIDDYYHMVRRRMNLADTLENIERVRMFDESQLGEYLNDAELFRFREYKKLREEWECIRTS